MFMFWFFTLFVYALANDIQLPAGIVFIMVFYALISDLLLYSLASQWVKTRPNVSKPVITKLHNIDPGIYRDSDAYNRIKMDIERTIKHPTDDPFERPGK